MLARPDSSERHHPSIVAEQRRIDVLVGAGIALDSRDVQPALVRERASPDVRLSRERRDIGELVDQRRNFAHRLELRRRHAIVSELELQVGYYRHEVRVAASLAETVDSALHL